MSISSYSTADVQHMRLAVRLARRGYGATSPNPMVGAVLVRGGRVLGQGWHRRAGEPHAEIEALRQAELHGHSTKAATLYVTLEPCCTYGRTPPCTEAILKADISRVVVGATDPNPRHSGRAFALLQRAGVKVTHGVLAAACERLNEAFNYWIATRLPLVTVKAAMTLDGKIATASGESKWITGALARRQGMRLRQGADALLVGINTIIQDDPALTFRPSLNSSSPPSKPLRRIVLDSQARTPLHARVIADEQAALTTIVVSQSAPKTRVAALQRRVCVLVAPRARAAQAASRARTKSQAALAGTLDLKWLLRRLGAEEITSLLVEGGGEVNASFLMSGLAQRIAFFYAPRILGGFMARRAVAGNGAATLSQTLDLEHLRWRVLGGDWLLSATVR